MDQIERTGTLCVAEEHVARGSLASELALYLMKEGVAARVTHLCAKSHHYARYGSQTYLRKASGLDTSHLLSALNLA